MTDTELGVFKVISQRKRIGQGQGVGGREQEERGIQCTVQSKHDFTWLLCPPSFCEEGVGGVKSSSAEMRPRPASCCSAPALCEAPPGPANGARFPFTSRKRHRSVSCFSALALSHAQGFGNDEVIITHEQCTCCKRIHLL